MAVIKQIIKHKRLVYPTLSPSTMKNNAEEINVVTPQNEETTISNNKKKKKGKDMANNTVALAEEIASRIENDNVKIVKKDKGLIERTESSKIILTEDNRQVLND